MMFSPLNTHQNSLSIRKVLYVSIVSFLACFILLSAHQKSWAQEEVIFYYDEAKTKKKEVYTRVRGRMDGPYIKYYENGNPQIEGRFDAGLMHGLFKEYFEDTFAVARTTEYEANKKQGSSIAYFRDGTIKEKAIYHQDSLAGPLTSYYANGKPKSKINFMGNFPEGIATEYYENGKVHKELTYLKGRVHGLVKIYDEAGNLRAEENYMTGLKHGQFTEYYVDGQIASQFVYEMGYKTGPFKTYFEDGTLRAEGSYLRRIS